MTIPNIRRYFYICIVKLKKFLSIMTGVKMTELPELTKGETDLVIDWEECVRTKPTGFMRNNTQDEAV
jgi:hypothetical protein